MEEGLESIVSTKGETGEEEETLQKGTKGPSWLYSGRGKRGPGKLSRLILAPRDDLRALPVHKSELTEPDYRTCNELVCLLLPFTQPSSPVAHPASITGPE